MSGPFPGRDSNSIARSRPATSDWGMLYETPSTKTLLPSAKAA